MKIPSANLHAFYILSQEGNFTASAKKLGISQPAFSQRIASLENFLETTLFIREKSNISLTPNGQKLLAYCNKTVQIENELLESFNTEAHSNSELKGEIRIGGFSSVMRSLLIPSLTSLLKNNPKLSIQTFTGELSEIPN